MRKLLNSVLLLSLILFSCDNTKTKQKEINPDQRLKVFTVNYPLHYFAERIGGEFIELIYPIPNDKDPAYWIPKELEEIQSADLILANGAGYAKWMEKVSLPVSKIVNTSKDSKDKYINIEEGSSHSHGTTGEHIHYGYAFTTWLDFKIAAGQAEAIRDAFIDKLPKHKAAISENFDDLRSELIELDKSMVSIGDMLKDKTVFVSHPVYQYMAKVYEIDVISEHWEPGETPSKEQWENFKDKLDQFPSTIMLWEAEPADEITSSLLELGIKSIVFNPCGNKPKDGRTLLVWYRSGINTYTKIILFDI